MTATQPEFTLGIEEEYFLVDRATRDVVDDPPPAMLADCEALLAGQVSPEFLRSQIEIGTRVCTSLAEARADLRHLRRTVAEVAARHGMAPVAAATHPFARWDAQKTTERRRYADLQDDLQGVVRRLAICGLHVHIGIPDDELRIDLLNRATYFLPRLLALSTSSPFWRGDNTGSNPHHGKYWGRNRVFTLDPVASAPASNRPLWARRLNPGRKYFRNTFRFCHKFSL